MRQKYSIVPVPFQLRDTLGCIAKCQGETLRGAQTSEAVDVLYIMRRRHVIIEQFQMSPDQATISFITPWDYHNLYLHQAFFCSRLGTGIRSLCVTQLSRPHMARSRKDAPN